jgi:hypothetical protein
MFQIDLQNIQAIGEAHMIIEDNTIVEFIGDNSNGKSVVSKVIKELTSGDISHEDVRRSLIKDGTDQGVVIFTHDKEQLGLILKDKTRDSLLLYYADITAEPKTPIIRALNDTEGCNAIVKQFGFRTYASGDICLQLHPTWGAIPFITTSGAVNDAIVQDITIDKVADNFLKTFQTITFPVFKDKIAKLKAEHDHAKTVLETMEAYDWRAYDSLYERMHEVWMAIKDYEYMELENIPIPNLAVLPVQHYEISNLPIVSFYDLCQPIAQINEELTAYVDVMNGVCPTCGKPLIVHEH